MSRNGYRKPSARPMVSITDLAARYGVTDDTIRRRVASGELPAFKVGRLIRIYLDDADRVFLVPVQLPGVWPI